MMTADFEKNEKLLLSITIDPSANTQKVQKAWKALSDLYLQNSIWNKYAAALGNLYKIMIEKNNIERAADLADMIVEGYVKANMLVEVGNFIIDHIHNIPGANASHILEMISKLESVQRQYIEIKLEQQKSSIRSALSSKKQADTAIAQEKWLEISNIFPNLLKSLESVSSSVTNYNPNENILNIIINNITNTRDKAMINRNEVTITAQDYFETCNKVVSALPRNIQLIEFLIEAWWMSPAVSYSQISVPVDILLVANPQHPLANAAKAYVSLTQGLLQMSKTHSKICHDYCNEMKATIEPVPIHITTTTPTTGININFIKSPQNFSYSICLAVHVITSAFDIFRGVSAKDSLMSSHDALRRLSLLESLVCPLQVDLYTMTNFARVIALSVVSEPKVCLATAKNILPNLFTNIDTNYQFNIDSIIGSIHYLGTKWLFLTVCQALSLYSQALQICSVFLTDTEVSSFSWIYLERGWCNCQLAVTLLNQKYISSNTLNSIPLLRDITIDNDSNNNSTTTTTTTAQNHLQLAIRDFDTILQSDEQISKQVEYLAKYRRGITQWCSGGVSRSDKNKGCLASFLSSAKLDPTFGHVYTYIGHYYSVVLHDDARAVKCYLKALATNPMDHEAGTSLSQLYIASKDQARAMKLWDDVIQLTSGFSSWSMKLKAQYQLCREEYPAAIDIFQRVLEISPRDAACWHGLAVGYSSLRQDVAAQKALLKAVELVPGNMLLQLLLADSERRLGQLSESLGRFQSILKASHSQAAAAVVVVALKGLGEVCLALGYQRYTIGWISGASRITLYGITSLDKALLANNVSDRGPQLIARGLGLGASTTGGSNVEYDSLWKLKGDLCCFAYFLGPSEVGHSIYTVPTNTTDGWGASPSSPPSLPLTFSDSVSKLMEVLRQGQLAYERVIQILTSKKTAFPTEKEYQEALAQSYYDLGLSYLYQITSHQLSKGLGSGLISSSSILQQDAQTWQPLLQGAVRSFAEGIRSDPCHSGCWNGLASSLSKWCPPRPPPPPTDATTAAATGVTGSYVHLQFISLLRALAIDNNAAALSNMVLLLSLYRQHEAARESYSALQLLQSNPLQWVTLGILLERDELPSSGTRSDKPSLQEDDKARDRLVSIHDAYDSSLEVAKPAEGLLGSAISWMKLHHVISPDGLHFTNPESVILLDLQLQVELRHEVEYKIRMYVQRHPIHPLAWTVLARAYELRSAFEEAREACISGLFALAQIPVVAVAGTEGEGTAGESSYVNGARQRSQSLLQQLYSRCQLKARLRDKQDSLQAPLLTSVPVPPSSSSTGHAKSPPTPPVSGEVPPPDPLQRLLLLCDSEASAGGEVARTLLATVRGLLQPPFSSSTRSKLAYSLQHLHYFTTISNYHPSLLAAISELVAMVTSSTDAVPEPVPLVSESDAGGIDQPVIKPEAEPVAAHNKMKASSTDDSPAKSPLIEIFQASPNMTLLFAKLLLTSVEYAPLGAAFLKFGLRSHPTSAALRVLLEEIEPPSPSLPETTLNRTLVLAKKSLNTSFSDLYLETTDSSTSSRGAGLDKRESESSFYDYEDSPVRVYCRAVALQINSKLAQSENKLELSDWTLLCRAAHFDPSDNVLSKLLLSLRKQEDFQ